MNRREYFLNALKSGAYRKAQWVFSVFTIVRDLEVPETPDLNFEYQLFRKGNQYVTWIDGQYVIIDDITSDRPLYLVEEGIELTSSDDIIQKTDIPFPFTTRIGSLFLNYYCLVSAFNDKIDYQNGKFTISDLERIVLTKLVDYPEEFFTDPDNTILSPDHVYPREVKLFNSACMATSGFSAIATPSATEYTMLPAPGIKEKRKELLERYKDRLDDPVVIAQIEKELVAYDKAHQANDPDGGFLQGAKVFNVSRKKLFIMGGIEMSEISKGKAVLVEKSLSEGWDPKTLPAMIDSLRNGSYNRGALTALGGEAVKFIFRIFSATSITEDDCGSKVGIPRILTPEIGKTYLGNMAILPDGKQIVITSDNLSSLYGKPIMVRSPGFCKTSGANFCLACCGQRLEGSKTALAAMASRVGSQMLDIFMAKMHGTALVTTKWRKEKTIS